MARITISEDDIKSNATHTSNTEHEQNATSTVEVNTIHKIKPNNETKLVLNEDSKETNNNAQQSAQQPDTIINMTTKNNRPKYRKEKLRKWCNPKFSWRWWHRSQQTQQIYPQMELHEQRHRSQKSEQEYYQEGYPPKEQKLYPPHGQPPKWVMFEGMREYAGSPLDYEPDSRNRFVAIVMLIVLFMLLCTATFLYFVFKLRVLTVIFANYGMPILICASIAMLVVHYSMVCLPYARVLPCCIVMLLLTIICMSCISAVITSRYRTAIIMYAVIGTAVVVLVCLILALTPFDFTKWYLYAVVISVVFAVISLVAFLSMRFTGYYIKPLHLVILFVSMLLHSLVLVMELQMILGGHTIELGDEDWALAAYMLYTSIIDIFLKLVQILGLLDEFE